MSAALRCKHLGLMRFTLSGRRLLASLCWRVRRSEEAVEFGYKKLDAKAYEKRIVEPWHLACVSGQWYLLGHDRNRKARRIFVLARMRRVSPTGQKFPNPRPSEAEIQRLFQNSFQIWQSENADLEQIVLRFSGRAAQLVRERNWHSSQQIQELADGNLEFSLTLNSLEEIVSSSMV